MENNLIFNIKFDVDKEKLLQESKHFRPKLGEDCQVGYGSAVWEDKVIGDRDRTNSGFIGKSQMTEEIKRVVDFFEEKLGVGVLPIFTTQRPNKELFMHTDPKEMKCAINFVISGNTSPITFKDGGDFFYESAVVNVSEMHCVKPQKEKRILFKLCINDLTFEEVKGKLNDLV